MEKQKLKEKRMKVLGKKYEPMPIETFRKYWEKQGYELIDITRACTFRLGESGWCNDFNKPDEEIYHIKVIYRDEEIGTFHPSKEQLNWDWRYIVFVTDEDFIIFRKVKIEKEDE